MPRILIADDEEAVRGLVARDLQWTATPRWPRRTALRRLEILTPEAGKSDLLLTDIKMPLMDGIAPALAAARDFPKLTILLMTGFADQRDRASGLNAIVRDV